MIYSYFQLSHFFLLTKLPLLYPGKLPLSLTFLFSFVSRSAFSDWYIAKCPFLELVLVVVLFRPIGEHFPAHGAFNLSLSLLLHLCFALLSVEESVIPHWASDVRVEESQAFLSEEDFGLARHFHVDLEEAVTP